MLSSCLPKSEGSGVGCLCGVDGMRGEVVSIAWKEKIRRGLVFPSTIDYLPFSRP